MATATPTDLTDAYWAFLAPLLPPPGVPGSITGGTWRRQVPEHHFSGHQVVQ